MLALIRKFGEEITIVPTEDLEPSMTVSELFKDGPITIQVLRVHNNASKVKIGVNAPPELLILRGELHCSNGTKVELDDTEV